MLFKRFLLPFFLVLTVTTIALPQPLSAATLLVKLLDGLGYFFTPAQSQEDLQAIQALKKCVNDAIIADDATELCNYLLLGVGINAEIDRCPLLGIAAKHGSKASVELLLSSGADVNETNGYEQTALECAAMGGYTEVVMLLLAAGAKTESDHGRKNEAFHLAIPHKDVAIVRELLRANANFNVLNASGDTPLDIAMRMRAKKIIQLLKECGAMRGNNIAVINERLPQRRKSKSK